MKKSNKYMNLNFDKLKNINSTINELLKEQTEMTNLEDQDVILANQFSEAIDNVIQEMESLINASNSYYILNIKLKKVFEFFKDTALYGCSFEDLRENTINKLQRMKREEKKKKVDNSITTLNEGVAYQVKIKDKEYIIEVTNNKLFRVV